MNILADTNAFIKWATDEKLPRKAAQRFEGAGSLFVSILTPWEIAIKVRAGKLRLTASHVESAIAAMGARLLPVTMKHIDVLYTLPQHHADPFDRMIIAQALAESCAVISTDLRFPLYKGAGLQVIWD